MCSVLCALTETKHGVGVSHVVNMPICLSRIYGLTFRFEIGVQPTYLKKVKLVKRNFILLSRINVVTSHSLIVICANV